MNMLKTPLIDVGRIERVVNAVTDSVKQLKLSIEKTSTQLNAATMREQTLANVGTVLALYMLDDTDGCSVPTIVISDKKKQAYAAVIRTRFNDDLLKSEVVTIIEGPCCATDFKALESLYKLSKAALQRAIVMSKNPGGFNDWDDLDLPSV